MCMKVDNSVGLIGNFSLFYRVSRVSFEVAFSQLTYPSSSLSHFSELASSLASEAVATLASSTSSHSQVAVDESQISAIVRKELRLFAADKTGLADFALESAGGSILSTRCSETYTSRSAMITLLGFPVW